MKKLNSNKYVFWKTILCTLLLFILTFNILPSSKIFAIDNPPDVAADSAVLIDALTGEILFQKNMNNAYPPASTTKIMTGLLTLENCDLDKIVTVGPNAVGIEGNTIWLVEGEQFTVKNLLTALMLESANDAAVALAEYIGGSVDNFAKMMNDRAKELGCKNTTFLNPNGLDQKGHKTSAYDLTLIMRELIKYPEYREIAKLTGLEIPGTNKRPNEVIQIGNSNRLVKDWEEVYYEYAEAGKTGFTDEAQHSFVVSAKKGNQRLIAAFIHDVEKRFYVDSAALFDYGFENFELVKLFSKGDLVDTYKDADDKEIPLLAQEDFYYVKKKGSSTNPVAKIDNIQLTDKKYYKGEHIGTASISTSNSTQTLKLMTGIEYKPSSNNTFNPLDEANTDTINDENKEDNSISKENSTNNNKPSKLPFIIIIVVIIIAIIIVRILQMKSIKKRRKKTFNPYIKK